MVRISQSKQSSISGHCGNVIFSTAYLLESCTILLFEYRWNCQVGRVWVTISIDHASIPGPTPYHQLTILSDYRRFFVESFNLFDVYPIKLSNHLWFRHIDTLTSEPELTLVAWSPTENHLLSLIGRKCHPLLDEWIIFVIEHVESKAEECQRG